MLPQAIDLNTTEGGAAADADQQVYLSPTTGLPRGIFNNSLIQDAEAKNKWKVNKDPAATIEDSEMQKTVEPPDHDTPLKAAYKPAVSPKQANRRQIIKRSPYTNTLQIVSQPGSRRVSPMASRKKSPPSLNYSDHRKRVDFIR